MSFCERHQRNLSHGSFDALCPECEDAADDDARDAKNEEMDRMMRPITDVEILESARAAYQDRYDGSDYVLWCEQCGDDASTHLMESGLVCRRCASDALAYGAMHND